MCNCGWYHAIPIHRTFYWFIQLVYIYIYMSLQLNVIDWFIISKWELYLCIFNHAYSTQIDKRLFTSGCKVSVIFGEAHACRRLLSFLPIIYGPLLGRIVENVISPCAVSDSEGVHCVRVTQIQMNDSAEDLKVISVGRADGNHWWVNGLYSQHRCWWHSIANNEIKPLLRNRMLGLSFRSRLFRLSNRLRRPWWYEALSRLLDIHFEREENAQKVRYFFMSKFTNIFIRFFC